MDPFLIGILGNLVSSKIYDAIRYGYKKLTDTPPVQKAIVATSERFPEFDSLDFALTTWCDSEGFDLLVERLRVSRLQDITDDMLIESFIQAGNFCSDDTRSDARRILHTFILEYQQAIYQSDQGQAAHAMRDLVDHARTHAGIDQLQFQNQQLSAQLTAVQQLLQQVTLPGIVQDALPSLDASEQQYQTKVDVARAQLLSGKPQTARAILDDLEKEVEGRSISNNLRGRIKGNLGACALALEQTDQAIALFREALTYLPNNPKALTNAALAAFLNSDLPETLRLSALVCRLEPHEPMAAALYVHALQLAGRTEEVEQMLKDEPWVSEDATCTLTLAEMCFDEHRYEDAEVLVLKSMSKDTENPVAYTFLAQVILVPIQQAIMQNPPLPWRLDDKTLARIEQAENALNRAIELLQRRETPAQLRWAFLSRSNCRRWAGKFAEAIADCDRVLQNNPQDSDALHSKAATLLQEDRFQEAVACYQKMPDLEQNTDANSALAYAYLQAGQPARTVELLLPLEQAIIADHRQVENISLLLEAHHKLDHTEQVNALIQRLIEAKPDDPDALSVIAEQHYREGDVEAAKTLLRQALEKAEGNTRERIVFRLAKLHFNREEYADAARMFEQVVDTSKDNPVLRQYIISLVNATMYDPALKIAQAIRDGGEPIPVISEAEALVLEFIHSPTEARDLWLGLSRIEPHKPRYVLRAVILNIQIGENDAARLLLEGIPYDRIKDDAKLLMLAAETRQMLRMPDVLPLAYQARRIGDERPEIHLAYVNLFLRREDADRPMLEPQEVGIDSAVRLTRNSTTKVFLIVEDKPTNRAAGERPPDDSLAVQLLGKHKGNQVVLKQNDLEEVTYEVADIQSKYVYAFQQTLTEFSTWFPGHPALHMVSVENNDFSKMFKMLDERHKLLVYVLNAYREKNLPLAAIAKMVGSPVKDAWAAQIGQRNGRLIATTGDQADNERQSALLSNTQEIVIDITAILTICYLDIEEPVRQGFKAIYIAQTVLGEIRHWLRDARESRPGGTVWSDGSHYYHREINEVEIKKNIEFLERIEAFAASLTVMPVPGMLAIGAEAYRRMSEIVGDSATASMLVAKDRVIPLYADDLGLRQLARSEWQVEGVWSQTVMASLRQRGIITEEQILETTKQLVLANYVYVSVTAELLMHIVRQANMLPTEEVIAVLRVLNGPICNDESAVDVASRFMRMVWLEMVDTTRGLAILDACLSALVTGRNGRMILAKFERALQIRFVLIPFYWDNIQMNIKAWASRRIL